MSQVHRQNAIGQFTYDWLIRFCELHPTSYSYFTKCNVPLTSKYNQISPLFTSMLKRYMPIVMYHGSGDVLKNEIQGFKKPAGGKFVILTPYYIRFINVEPGTITKYKNEKIHFNTSTLSFLHGVIDPDEFKFLLKQCRSAYSFGTKLSKPLLYSEIWTLLRPYMEIDFDMENLIFDDKMPEMLEQFPQYTPKKWKIINIDLREELVLPIVKNLLASPAKSYVHLQFSPYDYYNLTCENLANIAEEMFLEAGYEVDKGPATTSEVLRTVIFEKACNYIGIYYLN